MRPAKNSRNLAVGSKHTGTMGVEGVTRTRHPEDKHPVRGNPILLPGMIAMVTGVALLLAGIAYNASINLDNPVGVVLLGVGVFLMVLGEFYCISICFMKSEQIDSWNKRHKATKEVYRMHRKVRRHRNKRREWVKPKETAAQRTSIQSRSLRRKKKLKEKTKL